MTQAQQPEALRPGRVENVIFRMEQEGDAQAAETVEAQRDRIATLEAELAALKAAPAGAMDALREAEAALEVAIARILERDPGHAISVTSEAKALVVVRAALADAPAATAGALLEALESMVDVCEVGDFDGAPSDAHMDKARSAISNYRAALSANPAAPAQVVIPEPDLHAINTFSGNSPHWKQLAPDNYQIPGAVRFYKESTLHALLARAAPTHMMVGREIEPGIFEAIPSRELPEAVIDAVAAALGDAYDCTRVWDAWDCKTMSENDFYLVAEDNERVAEIARAAIGAYNEVRALQSGSGPADHIADSGKMMAAGAAQAVEPFMWAIQDADGKPYLDESCVAATNADMQQEVDGLNAGLKPGEGLFRVVPVYLCTPQDVATQAATFQQRVQPWMMACFGPEISADSSERNHRFLEESLELVQSCGCTQSEAHQLVDYVFNRPVGDPVQEVGGVMVTLAALCLANELDMHAAGETELARIWTKVEAIRAKQAAKPKHSPLPQAVVATAEQEGPARDAVGFSPMWFAPIDGSPVLLYLPTTTDKFAVGRWHGSKDSIVGNWGDDEGNFYTHAPAAFMSLQRLADIADKYVPDDVRAAIAAQAAKEGVNQ